MTEGLSAVLSRIGQIESMMGARPTAALGAGASGSAVTGSQAAAGTGSTGSSGSAGSTGSRFEDLLGLLESPTATGVPGRSGSGWSGSNSPGERAISIAQQYLGAPYRWGGNDPATGLDCSGLTRLVYGQLGVNLPRTSAQQATTGTAVTSLSAARPGDLVFFGSPVHHVGIYLGEGMMLDAPKAGEVVQIRRVYETPSRIRRVLTDTVPAPTGDPVAAALAALTRTPTAAAGRSDPYAQLFEAAGRRYGIDPALLSAVARTESNYDAGALSPAGARGLMQLMPGTAADLGVDPMDPGQAVDGAARLLADHLRSFGRVDLALAAYNAGPGAVRRYDGVPPYSETENYVRRVQTAWGELR